jgi:hypothetical protein
MGTGVWPDTPSLGQQNSGGKRNSSWRVPVAGKEHSFCNPGTKRIGVYRIQDVVVQLTTSNNHLCSFAILSKSKTFTSNRPIYLSSVIVHKCAIVSSKKNHKNVGPP